ncbi:Hsp70 family protein [Crateriforma conspicua]|uniref:Chaperone protein DnaK n=1 Tax=Crateriforma conspicua TaxID=2527996 RepID=A0A5C5Y2S8_9PLAN|nr:Hsp70 family protein [Crateriforma conspicua]TWT69099.1 Chaperone protein DnaK [Crateriforma conspicua]
MTAAYSVGIDLGTTNCVVGTFSNETDVSPGDVADAVMPIDQLAQPGQMESFLHLPSFLYLPRDGEIESLRTALQSEPGGGVAGVYARNQAADNPQRVVVAAKSWLCHQSVGRGSAVLPWQSPADVPKVSAVAATGRYLSHLIAAWQSKHEGHRLADQQVVLTVPASFDPAARELTRQAAIDAGLNENFVLLEEPQAAVYRFLAERGDNWRRELSAGDVMLVVDVGGGTCDFTLVSIDEDDGELNLKRMAVGNHLLVGGDNMDLALAHMASQKLAAEGHQLDPWQSVALWHACRATKEKLLSGEGPDEQTVSVLGRGSSLIASTISTTLHRDEVVACVLDGFFPACSADERPVRQPQSGFQDIGLPFEQDPAITKHIATFLAQHSGATGGDASGSSLAQPTHVLLNGGVFRSSAIRDRVVQTIASWCETAPTVLGGPEDLDTSVAIGAAYYGWSKQSGGIRIRGGTARSYYIGIETAGLAIPGVPRPLRALCVAPQGMEEGTETDVPGDPVGLVVGAPARFRFFASSVRADDGVGVQLDRWSEDELVESDPIELTLTSHQAGDDPFIPVQFRSRVTELGMFELWCHSTKSDDAWKMEFNVRDDAD